MKVSIHQPNFLPWFPFFEKMSKSDIFVLMTNCQFEKNGYQNRFKRNNLWNTMSTKKGTCCISQKLYSNHTRDWEKIKKRNKDFDLSFLDNCISQSLKETNVKIIFKISKILFPNKIIVLDKKTNLKGTDRILNILKENKATSYISGPSGKNYLSEDLFFKNNIDLIYHQNNLKISIIDYMKDYHGKV